MCISHTSPCIKKFLSYNLKETKAICFLLVLISLHFFFFLLGPQITMHFLDNSLYSSNNMFILVKLNRRNNETYQGFHSNHFKLILHNTLILDKNNITNLQRIPDYISYIMTNNLCRTTIKTDNRKWWFADLKGTKFLQTGYWYICQFCEN